MFRRRIGCGHGTSSSIRFRPRIWWPRPPVAWIAGFRSAIRAVRSTIKSPTSITSSIASSGRRRWKISSPPITSQSSRAGSVLPPAKPPAPSTSRTPRSPSKPSSVRSSTGDGKKAGSSRRWRLAARASGLRLSGQALLVWPARSSWRGRGMRPRSSKRTTGLAACFAMASQTSRWRST